MTIVVGQIESLKKLKEKLNEKGIARFGSIGEINSFLKNYESERKEIPKIIENSLDKEINNLLSHLVDKRQIYDDLKVDILSELNHEIKKLEEMSKQVEEKSNKNLCNKILYSLKVRMLANKKSYIEKNLEKIIRKKTRTIEREIVGVQNKLDFCRKNRENIISTQCTESYREMDYAKGVVDGLYALIAGVVGENSVVNELKKLPDNYYLINDFSAKFDPPIYNRKENDRIFSIQVDHLLICNSGVFLLETKNWSKRSINNFHLRSPVKQVLRTSYALFVLLNSESRFNNISLACHHWGSKKVPIRNVIVMINEKPKEEFKHAKVLSLNELNGYIKYFDRIFSDADVKNMFNYLSNRIY